MSLKQKRSSLKETEKISSFGFDTRLNYSSDKNEFIQKWGIKFQQPTSYIQSARFYPKDFMKCLTWSNYGFPENAEIYNLDHEGDKGAKRDEVFEQEQKKKKSVFTMWQESEQGAFTKLEEINFDCKTLFSFQVYFKGYFKFSPQGNLLALRTKPNEICIYDSSDISALLSKVKEQKFLKQIINESFQNCRTLSISDNEKVMAVIWDRKVQLYSMDPEDKGVKKTYNLNPVYKYILGHRLSSDGTSVHLACKKDGWRNLDIFNISDISMFASIRFTTHNFASLAVMISVDGMKAVLTSDQDNILYENGKQVSLDHFGSKVGRRMMEYKNGFIVALCHDYDTCIEFKHTHQKDFNIVLKRRILKQFNTFLDFQLNKSEKGEKLEMMMLRDEELFNDTIDLQSKQMSSSLYTAYKEYIFEWPYFCYISHFKNIFMHSAFNTDKIYRIASLAENETLTQLCITQSMDLIFGTQEGTKLKLFMVDLDNKKVSNQPIFQYDLSQVNQKPLYQIFARSSSDKEFIQMNNKMILFVKHKEKVYSLVEDKKEPQFVVEMDRVRKFTDDKIYFLKIIEGKMDRQSVQRLKITQTSYSTKKIFHLNQENQEIAEFEVDKNRYLYLFVRDKNLSNMENRSRKKREVEIIVYHLESEEVLRRVKILETNQVIGAVYSGNSFAMNGLIYVQNSISKLCMDPQSSEEEIKYQFHTHQPVINLSKDEFIPKTAPLVCSKFRKLYYAVKNSKTYQPKECFFMPLLNENKCYLNSKENLTQFCFYKYECKQSIKTGIVRESEPAIYQYEPFPQKFLIYSLRGEVVKIHSTKNFEQEYGDPVSVSNSGQIFLFRSSARCKFGYTIAKLTFEGFVAFKRFDLIKILESLLLQKHKEEKIFESFQHNLEKEFVNLCESSQKDQSQKALLPSATNNNISRVEPVGVMDEEERNFTEKLIFDVEQSFNVQIKEQVNDEGAVLFTAQAKTKEERDEDADIYEYLETDENEGRESVFQPLDSDINVANKKVVKRPFLICYLKGDFASESNQSRDFAKIQRSSLNFHEAKLASSKIILWSPYEFAALDLATQEVQPFSFKIQKSLEHQKIKIKKCYMSGLQNEKRIYVRVQQQNGLDTIIMWNMTNDLEIQGFDIESDAETFFDERGKFFIIDGREIVVTSQSARTQSYYSKIQNFDKNYLFHGINFGYRVSPTFHEHYIIRNFVQLPVNYFQLMVRDHRKEHGIDFNKIDIDAYTYIVRGQTAFHELALQSENLESVIKAFKKLRPDYLECLIKPDSNNNTPLHLAFDSQNFRSVNFLLEALAEIQSGSNTGIFKRIFDKLLRFSNFGPYLESCFIQTEQMKQIQALQVSGEFENRTELASCSVLDKYFFDRLEDKEQLNSHPVQMKALDIWWVFNTPAGLRFLLELSIQNNYELFKNKAVVTSVKYIWSFYKWSIIQYIMTPYILYFILFNLLIHFTPEDLIGTDKPLFSEDKDTLKKIRIGLEIVILPLICFFLYVQYRLLKWRGWAFFRKTWSVIDSGSLLLNLAYIICDFSGVSQYNLRAMAAIGIILIWVKSFYFFRIFDETAPMVRMILVIIKNIRWFILIFFVSILAFAQSYYLLNLNRQANPDLVKDGDEENYVFIETFMGALAYTYMQSLGEFEVDGFSGPNLYIYWFVFILCTFLLLLVMLNLLIAIMSDGYAEISGTMDQAALKERLQLVLENLALPNKFQRNKTKYLVQISKVMKDE